MSLTTLRAQFPLLDRWLYFNACSLGPLPRAGMAALADYASQWNEKGTPVWFSDWMPALERLRGRIAELLHAPAGSVALAPSVSVALGTIVPALLATTERRKVVIGEHDFPTLGHQFLSRPGLEVEIVRSSDGATIPAEAFAERIDADTALVATTHVFYTTGYVLDVAAVAAAARAEGAYCLVDGYQYVGCLPVHVQALGCDVFVAGCLKWLSGGPGTAFLYCRPELVPRLEPRGVGWMGTKDFLDFTLERVVYADDARRFETGTWPVPSHYAALAALELVLDARVEAICDRLRDLTGATIERCRALGLDVLTPAEREARCGIVSVRHPAPQALEDELRAAGMIVDSRPGILRLSPHWALADDDVERALDLLEERLAARPEPLAEAVRERLA